MIPLPISTGFPAVGLELVNLFEVIWYIQKPKTRWPTGMNELSLWREGSAYGDIDMQMLVGLSLPVQFSLWNRTLYKIHLCCKNLIALEGWGELPPLAWPLRKMLNSFIFQHRIKFANFEFTYAIRGPKLARQGVQGKLIKNRIGGFFLLAPLE